MKESNLIFSYIIALVAVILIYFLRLWCFEMITTNYGGFYYALIFILSLAIVIFFHIRYKAPNRFKTHLMVVVYAGLLSFFLYYTSVNLQMLFHSTVGESKTTVLKIDSVKAHRIRSTIEGGLIFVTYENQTIKFESSGTTYFALKDKSQIRLDIGTAGANNFYVSRIYWKDGEKWTARVLYWKYRFKFLKYFLGFILIVGAASLLVQSLNKRRGVPDKPLLDFEKSPFKVMLVIFGILITIGLILYIGLFLYMHFMHGYPKNN